MQTNTELIAYLLKCSELDAVKFCLEVQRQSCLNPSTFIIARAVHAYVQTHKCAASPSEIVDLIPQFADNRAPRSTSKPLQLAQSVNSTKNKNVDLQQREDTLERLRKETEERWRKEPEAPQEIDVFEFLQLNEEWTIQTEEMQVQEQIEEEEFQQLVAEMMPFGFTCSKQVSWYIMNNIGLSHILLAVKPDL
jgi:hypothetical protein